jgi:mono/diheme cytochrome c family protein
VIVASLSLWIVQLLPGRGHVHEPLAEPTRRPPAIVGVPGGVEQLRPGMPGYRLRLPQDVHPVSAGLKGGLVGGAAMPVPALLWGVFSGHGLWYPVNLLAGMVLPGVGKMTVPELEQFHVSLLVVALVIHIMMSAVIGILYGVLLPTLPEVPRPIAWGGLFMPILWTGASFVAMQIINRALPGKVSWPWFLLSQLVFGITMPAVVLGAKRLHPALAGVVGGLIGGAAMALPAVAWASASGHGFWYPINLLAGMVLPGPGNLDGAELGSFHVDWFLAACAVHAVLAVGFGVLFALVAPRLPSMPGPVAWGGLVLPLVWTGVTYGLMGVVNPVLQERVDWFWFIVSQFVFGVTAALVVLRSGMVHIPPAGRGPDRVADFVAGREERQGEKAVKNARSTLRTSPISLSPCLLASLSFFMAGCDLPGKPREADRPKPADREMDFGVLYQTRCAGCHGADGKLGPAPPLNDPIFLAIVPDAELLRVISEGRTVTPGQKSPMPAFARDKGGPLTGEQVKVLAEGIKKRWGPPASGSPPPYLTPSGGKDGNKEQAIRVFARVCARCHGPMGQGDKDGHPLRGGVINNPAFLALISDQALRRIIITGRPDLGMPAYDSTDHRPRDFRALTSAEIDDLVALLRSWRESQSSSGESQKVTSGK